MLMYAKNYLPGRRLPLPPRALSHAALFLLNATCSIVMTLSVQVVSLRAHMCLAVVIRSCRRKVLIVIVAVPSEAMTCIESVGRCLAEPRFPVLDQGWPFGLQASEQTNGFDGRRVKSKGVELNLPSP